MFTQIVQIKIRLLFEKQSDQGLHCLSSHLHLFDVFYLALKTLNDSILGHLR